MSPVKEGPAEAILAIGKPVEDEPMDEGGHMDAGGMLAMREMRHAIKDGDDAGAWAALKRAVAMCMPGEYDESE